MQSSLGTLQGEDFRLAHQTRWQQRAFVGEFFFDQLDLVLDRLLLRLRRVHPLFDSTYAVLQRGDIRFKILAPGVERELLGADEGFDVRVVAPRRQVGGKCHLRLVADLGDKTRLHCLRAHVTQGQPVKLRSRSGRVKLDQGLARLDDVAFAHEDVADDAAFQMLNDLVLARRHEGARGDHRASDESRIRPIAKSHHEQDHRNDARRGWHVRAARNIRIPLASRYHCACHMTSPAGLLCCFRLRDEVFHWSYLPAEANRWHSAGGRSTAG